jgi:hypothetical protein
MRYDVKQMKTIAKILNDRTYTDYFYRLTLIARAIFKWNNLPNGMNEKWIERYLFSEGKCLFFKDKEKGFMVTKSADFGSLNPYDEPVEVMPFATNYTGKGLENGETCVIIRNNDLMVPTAPTIELFAYRLAEISRSIDINISAQKTPYLILCTDKQKLSMKQVYTQVTGNEPVIYGDKNLDIDSVKVLNTNAPIVFDKLQIQKHSIWNECMTFLGVNNANMDKRERLVDDEVQANNEQIEICADVMLKARERACEEINNLFDLDISVERRKIKISDDVLTGGVEE